MLNVFLSYSRRSEPLVKKLVSDIEALGHTVWFDQELSGGQVWWNQILERVRSCDALVIALDPKTLESTACQREYGYAAALGKPILPLLVAEDVSINVLPPALAQIQFVDYREHDRDAVIRLARALVSLPAAGSLPEPLPPPPDVPVSYLGHLTEQVGSASNLSYEQQSALLMDLKRSLRNPGNTRDARGLLERMRMRRDLLANIAEEIDEALKPGAFVQPQAAPSEKPHSSQDETIGIGNTRQESREERKPDDPERKKLRGVEGGSPVAGGEAAVNMVGRRQGGGLADGSDVQKSQVAIARTTRVRAALIAGIVGTVVGILAFQTVVQSPRDADSWPWGFLTGLGAAIAGAISGSRPKRIAGAVIGAAAAWVVAAAAVNTREAFAIGGIFAAPFGAVFGAFVGRLLDMSKRPT